MNVSRQVLAMLAALAIGSVSLPLQAAQMYRCGNVYQDRPCESAQPAAPIPGAGSKARAADATTATAPGGAMHPTCAQRGTESQKIVWAREGGATEEKMLAAENDPARRQLIADVYRVRGSAPQVRVRIEAECQAELAEKAKALAIHDAMVRAGALPAQKAVPAGPTPEQAEAEAKAKALQEEQRQAALKTSRCNNLNAQRDSIREQQRRGGSGETMENLNRQRAQVDRQMRSTGC